MADSLLEKVTSAIGHAKETVTASAETAKTDVMKDVVNNVVTRGIDEAKSLLHNLDEKKDEVSSKILGAVSHFTGSADGHAKETVTASAETAKTDVVKDAVNNVVTKGIDEAKSLLHNLEEKKDEVSSKILGAVSHFTGSTDSAATTANHDLPVSTDNQPLLAAGDGELDTAMPWWKICCGVLDLFKRS